MKTNKPLYLISIKRYYTDGIGLVICVATSKLKAREWIRNNYPNFKFKKSEGNYECDAAQELITVGKYDVPFV